MGQPRQKFMSFPGRISVEINSISFGGQAVSRGGKSRNELGDGLRLRQIM